MSDYRESDFADTGTEGPLDPPAAPAPALQEYREAFDQPGAAPEARDLARDQTTLINDAFQRRDIALANEQIGQDFQNGVDRFKLGLVSMVQNDPLMLDLGLNLTDLTIDGMVRALPNVPDGLTHRDELTRHTQSEIAAAAITAAAEQDEGLARGMLSHPRVAGLLGESAGSLDTYITMQAQARFADREAEMEISQRRASEAADRSAINYLGALHDPQTDGVKFPPGWNQAILADNSLPPAATAAVAGIYNRLRTEGDAPASDPFLVSHLVSRIASNDPPPVAEVAELMGRGLTVADAMLLLGGAGSTTVQSRRGYTPLANTLAAAQGALAAPENGPAGQAAFARFTNWLMPAYRNGGPASLNPASDNFLLASNPIQAFAPTPADFADAAVGINIEPLGTMAREIAGPVNRSRKSLDQIFSSGGRSRRSDVIRGGDEDSTDDYDTPDRPLATGPGGPYFGVQRAHVNPTVGAGEADTSGEGPATAEFQTDVGLRSLTRADLARSSSGPRPIVSEEQQRVADGRQASGRPRGRPPRNLPANPRRRR